ncbi:MAG: hypothetical protein OEV39_01085, partial [Gammaproteobacteria bacterium]|nr:hypothetical protein [Gammaproteobacteria bacterium]
MSTLASPRSGLTAFPVRFRAAGSPLLAGAIASVLCAAAPALAEEAPTASDARELEPVLVVIGDRIR